MDGGSGERFPVSLVRCDDYGPDEVLAAVRRSVDLMGGMGRFVEDGQRVFLKLNLLRTSRPEDAIITHPAVVRAATILVQEVGGKVTIGDSPGGPLNRPFLRRVYTRAGLYDVARETGAILNEETSSLRVACPEGHLLKEMDIMRAVQEADVVIPLPKLKTHVLTVFTGATKILFGVIPGLTKPAYHFKLSRVDLFSHMLLDIIEHVKPPLFIMDGITAMEGDGPAAGAPFDVGAILAAADAVAMDRVATALVGLPPERVTTLAAAEERGMGPASLDVIEVLGDGLDAFSVTGFRPPTSAGNLGSSLPGPLRRLALRLLVPYPRAGVTCIGCGVCAANCPVKAITIEDGKASMDLSECIRCYCCHETCPHKAVELRTTLLSRFMGP